jgi:hypothetical protein
MTATPAVHLTADTGAQAYKEPYPRVATDGSHRAEFIPGRAVVHVVSIRGSWAQVIVNDEIVGWVEGSQLIPPIGTPIASVSRTPASSESARSQSTNIDIDTLVAALASIGILIGAVVDWTQGIAANSFKIPAAYLVDPHTTSRDPRLGYFVIALGIAGVFLSFVRNARFGRGAVGIAALGIALLFCGQVAVQLSDQHSHASFTDIVGAGPWITGIAGLALAASALLSSGL